MKYMGSKNRISKEILPIILKNRKDRVYVEPFVGGCNMIDKVDGVRIGADNNKYLIAMWVGLQNDIIRPVNITKEIYSRARNEYNNSTNIEFSDFEIGWIGWMGSFNGRFFDGGYSGKTPTREYIWEQIKNTESQIDSIRDVVFVCGSYDEIKYPDNSIIYCDPPYKGTKQYSTSRNFNHSIFWQWCRDMQRIGHDVFISEYEAPDDFTCVWSKQITNSMNIKNTYKTTEKLFKFNVI